MVMTRAEELKLIEAAVAAGRCRRITLAEMRAHNEARQAADAARRASVDRFFIRRPRPAVQG
jgi:hypothetical protein